MNTWQLAKQFRYLLRSRTWEDAGSEVIFGQRGSYVTNGDPKELYGVLSMPCCLIGIGEGVSDREDPGYVKQEFRFLYMCQVAGDMRSENVLLGANRVSGALSSKNRGVLEVEEEISRLLNQIQETSGIKIIAGRRSAVAVGALDEDAGYIAAREMVVEAKCTTARYYHPPLRVAASVGGGNVTLTWADPPDRFDGSGRTLRIRKAAGATAPATVTDGSQVADVARGVQTYQEVAPGSGTYSYSIFAGYSDSGAASNERYSNGTATEDGMSVTSVVVP